MGGRVFLSIDSSIKYSVLIKSLIETRIASLLFGNLPSATRTSKTLRYDSGRLTEINFIKITLNFLVLINTDIYESDIFKDLVEIDPKKSDRINNISLLHNSSYNIKYY